VIITIDNIPSGRGSPADGFAAGFLPAGLPVRAVVRRAAFFGAGGVVSGAGVDSIREVFRREGFLSFSAIAGVENLGEAKHAVYH
jgi:hypothetical protein